MSDNNILKNIDKTLPEIIKLNNRIDREELMKFMYNLVELGADIIEIDMAVLKCLNKLPEDISFLLRVNSLEEFKTYYRHEFYGIIISVQDPGDSYFAESIKKIVCESQKTDDRKLLSLDIEVETPERLKVLIENNSGIFKEGYLRDSIDSIRISGISMDISLEIEGYFIFLKENYGTKIDICADNRYNCATAISIEASSRGIDFISSTFCGVGQGYAALEEVIMALMIIENKFVRGNTRLLPEIKAQFESLVFTKVPAHKAIVGEEIFRCESGIHIDGILKEPSCYEPYNPELVGQKREFVLGKHSGRAALQRKSEELGLDMRGIDILKLMDKIKEKCSEFKGGIEADLLKELVSEMKQGW